MPTPQRVLVVDDHAENRYLLRALLEGHGFAVDDARHGEEALAVAADRLPDVVVSDLLMPVMDGYALLREWRRDPARRHVPFVVYTATFTEPRDERLAMALGAAAFLVKPAEPELLLRRVREVLAAPRNGGPAPEGRLEAPDAELLREYNEVLVAKLEQKARELETANRELRAEIAERQRTEAEVARTGQLFRAVVEGTSDAIYVKSLDGTYLLFNAAAARGVGRRVDEVLGRDDIALHGPVEGAALRANDDAVLRTGVAVTCDETLTVEGKPRVFLTHKAPFRDAAGRIAGVVGISRDITERRQLEEQLRQSQKMDAVGRLAGGVAHDFNNLLTVIGGYSEQLLMEGELSADAQQSVRAIHEAGKRASQLTRQLLSFSRQAILQPRLVDVNQHVARTAQMLRRLIGEDIEFQTVLDQRCETVRVDPGQLDQVLMNLAVNARDAMPRGGRLTLETRPRTVVAGAADAPPECAPGDYVMLAMTDTGTGMSREVVERIFEPFFTTKEPGKGTGLGLSMVFGIVKQSDGAIDVESTPGAGTTFRIYLPVVREPTPRTSDPGSAERIGGDETILVVEDDEGVRALTVKTLEMHGYRVLVAPDGPSALDLSAAHAGRIDLLLSDVVMPQMGGPVLAEALKAVRPGLRVLFMSGYTDDSVVRHGLEDATVDFLQKPYTTRALARKVRQVLDGAPQEA